MPVVDRRAAATTHKGKFRTAGKERVVYRNARGQTRDAIVLGEGTASGLRIQIVEGTLTRRIIDNVPAATGLKQTNVYFARR